MIHKVLFYCKQRISQDNGNNEENNDTHVLYVLHHCFLFHLLQWHAEINNIIWDVTKKVFFVN